MSNRLKTYILRLIISEKPVDVTPCLRWSSGEYDG